MTSNGSQRTRTADRAARMAIAIAVLLLLPACASSDTPDATRTSLDSSTTGLTALPDTTAATATPSGSVEPDFLYQTRVGDGLGVFVSVDGREVRVDEAAPGSRHKHPTWTNDGSAVAFVAEGEWDAAGQVVRPSAVWVVGPGGEDPHEFIDCECWDLNNPSWSPDGRRVAFAEFDAPVADGPPASSRIVVLDVASGTRTVVARSQAGELIDIPRWSPDGSMLVISIDRFDSSGNETGSSFGVIPAGGGSVAAMLPFEEFAYAADWSWATDTLVFSVESQGYASPVPKVSPWDLFEIQPDGTGRRAITDIGNDQRLSLPVWSSDGSLIAATLDTTIDEPGGQMAVVVDPATGVVSPLADPVSDYARLRPTRAVVADNASGWIAYQVGQGISFVRPDGTDGLSFSTSAGDRPHHPDWSPDGYQLAFVAEDMDGTSDIWVSALDGSDARRVVDCQAPCAYAEDPSWSSDGTRLAYWTNGPTETTQDIRVVEVSTGTTMLTVTGDELTGPVNPKWSPDDTHLAVEVQTFEQQGADFVMADSAIGIIDLASASPSIELITAPGMFAAYPDWNHTGDQLVFQAGNGDPFSFTGSPPELFTARPDGSELTQLTKYREGDAWVALPDWTAEPDERILVTLIHSASSYTLGSVDLNGAVTELVDAGGTPIDGAHPRLTLG